MALGGIRIGDIVVPDGQYSTGRLFAVHPEENTLMEKREGVWWYLGIQGYRSMKDPEYKEDTPWPVAVECKRS